MLHFIMVAGHVYRMHSIIYLFVILLLRGVKIVANTPPYHQYCVVGAGPGGLQIAYFLQEAGRDYIVFEKGYSAGTFYTKFPIHRKLISINKRHTGKTNKEFNLRHDWNSLISHDESLQIGKYTKDFFPPADILVKYLNDFVQKLNINVQFNTTIGNIKKRDRVDKRFHIKDQHDREYTCEILIVATGIATPNRFEFPGSEYVVGYEDLTLDTEPYEGKSVLILGHGNSAFETAEHIISSTQFMHMLARSRIRLAWSTHYVGDLRAINNGLLDTYQLKSLDGILERDVQKLNIYRSEIDGRLHFNEPILDVMTDESKYRLSFDDNSAVREGYDIIISCLGFKFDTSIYNNSVIGGKLKELIFHKYPNITYQYESAHIANLFYAGTNTHSLDIKRSAGGFIHGFRYCARTMHRIMENRYHNVNWPSITFESPIDVIPQMMKRFNEASDIYQMFSVLCEVMIFSEDEKQVTYLEAYPCILVSCLPEVSGHSVPGKIIIGAMEYGKNASGPAKDVFDENRSRGDGYKAHSCNFLHPVLYFYKRLPKEEEVLKRPDKWILPVPDRIHHILEDFTTVFDSARSHMLLVRRFFENVLGFDLRNFFAEHCMAAALTSVILPESCTHTDMRGQGMTKTKQLSTLFNSMIPWPLQRMMKC